MKSTWQREHAKRVYFQDIVYDLCGILEEAFDEPVRPGTPTEKSSDVQQKVKRLVKLATTAATTKGNT